MPHDTNSANAFKHLFKRRLVWVSRLLSGTCVAASFMLADVIFKAPLSAQDSTTAITGYSQLELVLYSTLVGICSLLFGTVAVVVFSKHPAFRRILDKKKLFGQLKEERAEIKRREDSINAQADILLDLSRLDISRNFNIAENIRRITEHAFSGANADRVSIWLYGESNKDLACLDVYERKIDKHHDGPCMLEKDYPEYFSLLRRGEVIVLDNVHAVSALQSYVKDHCREHDIYSIIEAPIRLSGQLIGWITFSRTGEPQHWSPDDRKFAVSLANVTSLLFESASHQQKEAQLRESQTQFRNVADYTYDWESWLAPDGSLIWVNPAVERMTGHGVDECLSLPDYPYSLIRDDFRDQIRQALTEKSGNDVRFPVLHKDGSTIWVAISWQEIFDETGESTGTRTSIRDVSESKKAQDDLQESEQRYRDTLSSVSDWVWETDEHHRFKEIGDRPFQAPGLGKVDIIGKTRIEVISEACVIQSPEKWRSHQDDLDNERPFRDFGYSLYDANGQPHYIVINGVPIYDNEGAFVGYRGAGRDVTAEHEAQNQLTDAVESISDDLLLLDSQDRFVMCNSSYRKSYAVINDILTPGTRFEDLLMAAANRGAVVDALENPEQWVRQRLAGHNEGQYDYEQTLSNDRIGRVREYRTQNGGAIIIRTDITAQKESENTLRKNQALLIEAQKIANVGNWEWNISSNDVTWSEMSYNILGVSQSEPVSYELFLSLVHPQDRERVNQAVEDAFEGRSTYNIDYRIVRRDGEERLLHAEAVVEFDESGRAVRMAGINHDITEKQVMADLLEVILKGVSSKIGDTYFASLTEGLVKALDVDIAFVGRLSPNKENIQTISVHTKDGSNDNFKYGLANSPCERILTDKNCETFIDNVASRFPEDTILADMGADSYFGASLINSSGDPIGILVMISKKPIKNSDTAASLIKIFAARASAELEREITNVALIESRNRMEKTLETAADAIVSIDSDGAILSFNPAAEELFGYTEKEALHRNVNILMPKPHRDHHSDYIGRYVETKESRVIGAGREVVGLRKNGEIFPLEIALGEFQQGDETMFTAFMRDITDRLRADEALRESEKRYRDLFTRNKSTALLVDPEDGRIVDATEAACQYYGYGIEDIRAMDIYSISMLDRQVAEGLTRQAISGTQSKFTSRHRLASGEVREVEVASGPVSVADKELLLEIVHDITERMEAERELKQSHGLLSVISDIQKEFIDDRDPADFFNGLLARLLVVSESEIGFIGEAQEDKDGNPSLKTHAETGMEARDLKSFLDAILKTGERVIFNNPTDDEKVLGLGKRHPTVNSFMGLPFYSGDKIVGIMGVANRSEGYDASFVDSLLPLMSTCGNLIEAHRNDVLRGEMETALKDSEEQYRSMVERSPNAIFGHRSGVILYANATTARLLGVKNPKNLIGRKVADFLEPDQVERFAGRSGEILDKGETTTTAEYMLIRADGKRVPVEGRGIRILVGGEPAVESVLQDVTQRKLAEDEFFKTTKLATLGELAAGMAHELSQPLNIIRFAAEGSLLKINKGKSTQEKQIEQFKLIESQSARMSEIMDHMRVFSRSDVGKYERFNPTASVSTAAEMLRGQFKAEGIIISTDHADKDGHINGRPVQLEQVILNLLKNARDAIIDYGSQMGKDIHYAGKIHISTSTDGSDQNVLIRIVDNGGGIPEDRIDHIFDPFFTTKEAGAGTGLGLSVSYSIIQSMSGNIKASNTNLGSAFEIKLPLVENNDTEEQKIFPRINDTKLEEGMERRHKIKHILIVDDEENAVSPMAEYLKDEGYRVSTAYDGIQALNAFNADPADILVTDIRMPNCDGRELIRKLREKNNDLPVIISTGHISMQEAIDEKLETDRTIILRKPLSLSTLGEAINEFARH